MSEWTRRDLLKLGLTSFAFSKLGCGSSGGAARPLRPVAANRPRYYVVVLLTGGFDAVYTTDPKQAKDVESGIDLPYKPDAIVDAGGYQLGPHFAPLAKWGSKMAVLNGVQMQVANHETGGAQFSRLRTKVKYSTPSALDTIAEYREGQPLGSVAMGPLGYWDYTANWFGEAEKVVAGRAANDPKEHNLLDEIDGAEVADLERLATIYRRQAKKLREGGAGSKRIKTAGNLEECATLFERLPSVPRFSLEEWSPVAGRQNIARNMQRTLWLLENDLTSCVFLKIGYLEWDSHYANVERQTEWNGNIAVMLDRFMTQLEGRKNAHGSLMSNTVVAVGSELGRFPRLNPHHGKDHFPETPFFFFGKGIRAGQGFGQTGRQMEALPISLKTGKHVDTGGEGVFLDDVGTTFMHLAGVNPEVHGYFGKRLPFLVTT